MTGFKERYYSGMTDQDGRVWKCLRPVEYTARDGTVYTIPVGASTDGASVPAIFWSKLPPFGPYWLAAVLHDAAYGGFLRLADGSKAFPNATDRPLCDLLIKEAMEETGVDAVTVTVIYDALVAFGGPSFKEDRGI